MAESLGVKAGKAMKEKAAELYRECVERSDSSTQVEKDRCVDGVAEFLEDVTENSDNAAQAARRFLNSKLAGFDHQGNPIFRAQDESTKSSTSTKE